VLEIWQDYGGKLFLAFTCTILHSPFQPVVMSDDNGVYFRVIRSQTCHLSIATSLHQNLRRVGSYVAGDIHG
jgi:hypothetical protein